MMMILSCRVSGSYFNEFYEQIFVVGHNCKLCWIRKLDVLVKLVVICRNKNIVKSQVSFGHLVQRLAEHVVKKVRVCRVVVRTVCSWC